MATANSIAEQQRSTYTEFHFDDKTREPVRLYYPELYALEIENMFDDLKTRNVPNKDIVKRFDFAENLNSGNYECVRDDWTKALYEYKLWEAQLRFTAKNVTISTAEYLGSRSETSERYSILYNAYAVSMHQYERLRESVGMPFAGESFSMSFRYKNENSIDKSKNTVQTYLEAQHSLVNQLNARECQQAIIEKMLLSYHRNGKTKRDAKVDLLETLHEQLFKSSTDSIQDRDFALALQRLCKSTGWFKDSDFIKTLVQQFSGNSVLQGAVRQYINETLGPLTTGLNESATPGMPFTKGNLQSALHVLNSESQTYHFDSHLNEATFFQFNEIRAMAFHLADERHKNLIEEDPVVRNEVITKFEGEAASPLMDALYKTSINSSMESKTESSMSNSPN